MKRKKYLSWDAYFMSLAMITSLRSKDPNTRCGAIVVDPRTNIVKALGYNGMPRNCSDDIFPWTTPAKYNYVCHAELNCILNCDTSLSGCVMYLYTDKSYKPCNECAKAIAQKGICKVVLFGYAPRQQDHITDKIFGANGISVTTMTPFYQAYPLADHVLGDLLAIFSGNAAAVLTGPVNEVNIETTSTETTGTGI